jgi:hypothetical protein
MLADFFTKPLQGSLFRKFREVIMGHKHIDTLKQICRPHPRIGEHNFMSNGTDGQKTDVKPPKPMTFTYVNAALKGAGAA